MFLYYIVILAKDSLCQEKNSTTPHTILADNIH